ncbi:MAG: monovalent cation/H(+) antiporter subunit G [Oscillospiraceae bacterium]|nr:monovalent cation/H(+) antiporter subunit G [Oscillospiraceae bacterium]
MTFIEWVRFILAALLMVAGLIVLFGATLGLFRFKYVLNRIHAAAACDTFGLLLTFSSLILIFGWDSASLKLLVIIIFLWISNPVSTHLIAHIEVATNPGLDKECEVMHHDDC